MKTFWLLLLLSSPAFACQIVAPHKLVILDQDAILTTVRTQDCKQALLHDLKEILGGVEGRILSRQIIEMLASRGHEAPHFEPSMVQIKQFKHILREQLTLPAGVQVKSTKGINLPGVVALAPGDNIQVQCEGCLYESGQLIRVKIKGFDGVDRDYLASADFKKMVRAYRVTSNLSSFSSIEPKEYLREEYIESIPLTDLITDLEVLKFYKTNKPIPAGSLLKTSDLNAISLVKAGLKTEVILENQMIRIKTLGISRSNGSLGEIVEVFHPQKNRKYQGKVVDINKVLVEL